ncbi:NfeD family protein [Ewingella sp. S1.OA.A_B6]
MLQQLIASPHLFWLSLGGLLLAAELLGASGYLLWSGIAAALVGLLTWVLPLPWEWQGLCFAVLTMVAAWLWWRWLSRRQKSDPQNGSLNQRGQQMVGMHATVLEPMSNGYSRVRIGDSTWRITSTALLSVGDDVVITQVEGITLRVEPTRS